MINYFEKIKHLKSLNLEDKQILFDRLMMFLEVYHYHMHDNLTATLLVESIYNNSLEIIDKKVGGG